MLTKKSQQNLRNSKKFWYNYFALGKGPCQKLFDASRRIWLNGHKSTWNTALKIKNQLWSEFSQQLLTHGLWNVLVRPKIEYIFTADEYWKVSSMIVASIQLLSWLICTSLFEELKLFYCDLLLEKSFRHFFETDFPLENKKTTHILAIITAVRPLPFRSCNRSVLQNLTETLFVKNLRYWFQIFIQSTWFVYMFNKFIFWKNTWFEFSKTLSKSLRFFHQRMRLIEI